jgi:hypothetical protein
MQYKIGDRMGGRDWTNQDVYIGTVYKVSEDNYWINVDGGGKMVFFANVDTIKPVCKSSSIVYPQECVI